MAHFERILLDTLEWEKLTISTLRRSELGVSHVTAAR